MTALELSWGARTDTGLRRSANEDSMIAEPPVFLVADGMGGHEAGDVASRLALDAFRPLVGREWVSIDDIVSAFREAVRLVAEIDSPRASAAGTTITGVALSQQNGAGYWLVLNIGDSRTYRLADGELAQISVDHSAIQELIDAGSITSDQVSDHPERHVITKAVGAGSVSEPDYWLLPASGGDRMLVCSDGLSRELDDDRIALALRSELSPQAAANRLVQEALAAGGHDNVSVIVVDASGDPADDFPTARVETDDPDLDTIPRLELERVDDDQI